MSLHTLANHMSAHGRGPDSTLVHMSPREIQGLQSLAQAHGRYLTVNPQTGLPEAGILEDILPSIAGFAMDAFAPGSGTIASGIASLMGGESSSEPARSNPMGLASTSLERGLQAGFGTDIYEPSSKQMSEKESPAGSFGAIQSAINTAPPKDYLQENKYNMYSEPQRYDSGGMTIGNVGAPVDASGNPIVIDPYDTRTDSQKAQDYLLGKPGAVNPFLFYHGAIPKATEAPAALSTADISALAPDTGEAWSNRRGGGSGSFDKDFYGNPWDKLSDVDKAKWFAENPDSPITKFQKIVEGIWPYKGTEEYKKQLLITQGIDPVTGLSLKTPAQYNNPETGAPMTPSSPYVQKKIAETDFSGMDRGSFKAPFTPSSPEVQAAINSTDFSGMDKGSFNAPVDGGGRGSGDGGGGYSGAPAAGSDVGRSAPGSAHLAHGGGIAALAQGGYNLGSYSDGGRLLRGPGNGTSDDIPAIIGQNQPARLADGEFVFPARIVSELGNGSTEAGARELYKMMDRIQQSRAKTTGKSKVAFDAKARNHLSA